MSGDDVDLPLEEIVEVALTVNPNPQGWTLIEAMEVRREFGYAAEDWKAALEDSPELIQIGAAWLELRKHEPGITWKEAGERITLGDLGGLSDPKGQQPTTKRRPGPRR